MKPEDFVKKIRQSVLDENVAIYRDLFDSTEVDKASDEYWKKALRFYGSLDKSGQEILFKIMRQVSVDTISNLLGVLDGVSSLEDTDVQLKLIVNNDMQEVLSGDLQDIFLEMEEDQ